MKKDCNGMSFDKVFAQRGDVITLLDIKIGDIYLCVYNNVCFEPFLFELINTGIVGKLYVGKSLTTFGFFLDYTNSTNSYISYSDMTLYLATPDQIALLNSYKKN